MAGNVGRADIARQKSWQIETNNKEKVNENQWGSQAENLASLCKFKIIIIIHFF
jgi:hypothetical protein